MIKQYLSSDGWKWGSGPEGFQLSWTLAKAPCSPDWPCQVISRFGSDYPRIQEAFVSFWFHGNASQSGTTEDCNQLTQKATKLICLSIFTLPLTSNISTICFQRNRWGEDRERVDPSLVWHQLNLNFEFAILNSQLSSSILNSQVRDQLKLDNRTEWSPCFGCLHQRPFDFPDLFLARPQIVSSFQNYTYLLLVWNLTLQIINQSRKDLDV